MAQTVKSSMPAQIAAGDSVKWQISLGDYPASEGWQLHYTLNKLSATINIDSSANGDDHLIDEPTTNTATWAAGDYVYVAYVDGVNSERHTIGQGRISITPNLAAASGGFDNRSAAQKCLDELDTALAVYGKKAYTQEYQIGDRRMKFNTPGDFMAFRSKIQAEVAKEKRLENIQLGKPSGSKLLMRF
jgi:hypothetical protein